ncbi:mitogen-activated protein kinase kinase kinase 7-interacting protein 3 homolog isoform X1 [Porites lutea]|uniref:mitogen-activated protein kinase kinase kinase 7-interacting protein 3 homolog isoform X1 n=2 Tax=Porites lutea TaxID=51062 RepID=UPI003CC6572A
MVDTTIFMAAERNGHSGQIFEALRNRFPEIPEQVISRTLQTEHGNPERCLAVLTAESDKILYGGIDVLDSPMPVQPTSQNTPIDEPISITIPSSTTSPYVLNRITPPLHPAIRPMTVGQPSPSAGFVSPVSADRPLPSAVASYDKTLLCHQRQRLETLKKEIYNEHHKLIRLRSECQEKETDRINKKFRVAPYPTSSDVRHLRDENHVLTEEIEQMTREIDELSNGREVVIGHHPNSNPALNQLPTYPPPVRRVESFPSCRANTGANGRASSLHRFCSMIGSLTTHSSHDEESPSGSISPPPPDGGSVNDWVFLPPNLQTTVHTSENTTWTCTVCTFLNHEALEVCEMCDMPRNRAMEARA